MRRFLLASLVLAVLVPSPLPARALSCVGPTHTSPEAIVRSRLDVYRGSGVQVDRHSLFVVGTVVHRGELEGDHPFPRRVLTVVVAGGYGNPLASAVLKIESTQWDDVGGPGGGVNEPVYLPLRLGDDGIYRHGMCDIWGVVEDPYQLAAELAPISERVGLPYQLFPVSLLEEVLSPTTTTTPMPDTTGTTSAMGDTTIPAAGGTIYEGGIELPARAWRGVALGLALLVVGAGWLWWLKRSDLFRGE